MAAQFSKRAQAVLAAAERAARESGALRPTAWHLLQAVLEEEGGGAYALLRRCEVDLAGLQSACEREAARAVEEGAEFDEWAAVLNEAVAEAKSLGSESAGTTHLLLGILKHGKSRAAACLRRFGLELEQLRRLAARYSAVVRKERACEPPRPALQAATCDFEVLFSHLPTPRSRPDVESEILAALCRTVDRSVVLYGVRGAGKHSAVRSIARQVGRENMPFFGSPLRCLHLALTKLVGWRWQRAQQRIGEFIQDLSRPGPYLLVVDDLDLYPGSTYEGEALFFLRLLARSAAFPVVFLCLPSTYACFFDKDPLLSSLAAPIEVLPPCGREALEILRHVRDRLEKLHGIAIPDETLEQAFVTANQLYGEEAFTAACRALDKAAGCFRSTAALRAQQECAYLEEQLAEIVRKKQQAVQRQDYAEAARLRDEENRLREEKLSRALSEHGEAGYILEPDSVIEAMQRNARVPSSFQACDR